VDLIKRREWITNKAPLKGVAKSMVAMATIDVLRERGEDVFLVDCDSSNRRPDRRL
jgi:CO dehydrogenase nickel-insertion accessory protein CooC1